jgi:hypothetical protein
MRDPARTISSQVWETDSVHDLRGIDGYLQIGRLQGRALEDIVRASGDDQYQVAVDAEHQPVACLAGVDADRDGAGLVDEDVLEQANRWRSSSEP